MKLFRPIPQATDEVADSADVLMLQWLYLGQDATISWFLHWQLSFITRNIVPFHSPSIKSTSLRQAILVLVGLIRSGGNFGEQEWERSRRARLAIAEKVENATVDEGDLMAAAMLALTSREWPSLDPRGFEPHTNGIRAITKHLSKKRSDIATVWSVVKDALLSFYRWRISDSEFFQLYSVCGNIMRVCPRTKRASLLHSNPSALIYTLRTYEMVLSRGIQLLLAQNSNNPHVYWVVQDINDDLKTLSAETYFAQFLQETGNSSSKSRTFAVIQYRVCELLVAVFDASTIVKGFHSSGVIHAAKSLLDMLSQAVDFDYDEETSTLLPSESSWWFRRAIVFALLVLASSGTAVTHFRIANGKRFPTISTTG
jgi:hypothetical protein